MGNGLRGSSLTKVAEIGEPDRLSYRPLVNEGDKFRVHQGRITEKPRQIIENNENNDLTIKTLTVNVPKLRDISETEGISRLFSLLRALDVDCELNESGTGISYGPGGEGIEGSEAEFAQSLVSIFDARLLMTHK